MLVPSLVMNGEKAALSSSSVFAIKKQRTLESLLAAIHSHFDGVGQEYYTILYYSIDVY